MRKRRVHARSLATAVAGGGVKSPARASAPPLLQRQAETPRPTTAPQEKAGEVNLSAQYAVAGIVPEGGGETAAIFQVVPPGESVTPPAGHRLLCFLYPDGTGVKFSGVLGQMFLSDADVDREFGSLKKRAEPMLARFRRSSVPSPAPGPISRSADGSAVPSGRSSAVQAAFRSTSGSPLPSSSRRKLESSYGADLGQVRVHTDSRADQAARTVQAKAFTTGQDVFFRAGEFQPSSRGGEKLLAHEVAHTVQQSGAIARKADPDELQVSQPQDPLEQEADVAAEKALLGKPARIAPLDQVPSISREIVAPSAVPVANPAAPTPNRERDQSRAPLPANEAPATPRSGELESTPPPATAAPAETAAPAQVEPPTAAPAVEVAPSEGGAVEGSAPAREAEETGAPESPASMSPDRAIAAVGNRAAGLSEHQPADVPVGSAQAAAIDAGTERSRGAATATVANLDAAQEGTSDVRRDEFKRKLRQAIEDATPEPTTEAEAEQVMATGAQDASRALRGTLATEQAEAVGPLESAAGAEVSPSTQESPPETDLESEQVGSPPEPVSGSLVVPPPLPAERLDYSADRAPADNAMAENNITNEQLERGNEPAFGAALEARTSAETNEASAEARYRQSESNLQEQAEGTANESLAQGLGGLYGERAAQIGQVAGRQSDTMSRNAAERQRITDRINAIKDRTKTDVETILTDMETEASNLFGEGLEAAETAYENAFEEAKGGIGTWLTTWGSDWERHIEASLATARREYLRVVDRAIDDVANCVDRKLQQARQRVADGRREVEAFVSGLDESVRQFGEEALRAVSGDFDAMESGIDERRDALVNTLTEQYKSSYERMSAREEELRSENRTLWQRVYDATLGVVEQILAFKNMLLGVLSRAANAIELIIADPIGFLGNLVEGVKLGVQGFVSNIVTHLKNGFFEWLFGTLAAAGLQIPAQFDLKGILDLVLQVLGLTYANFRRRAVNIVGEEIVSRIEQVSEIFKILITEGVGGLWEYIKEQVSGMISTLIEGIKSFLIEKVIVAGVTWIIGLLNPASAFLKACKAIYDIIMFFVERGRQILALVNAVIDSVTAIARGSLSGAAQFVENALARGIPVAIGFLASLLGLGGLSTKIKELIERIQAPVNRAIDWVINKAVALVKRAGRLLGFGEEKDSEDDRTPEQKAAARDQALAEAESLFSDPDQTVDSVQEQLADIKSRHRVAVLRLVEDQRSETELNVHIEVQNSEPKKGKTHKISTSDIPSDLDEFDDWFTSISESELQRYLKQKNTKRKIMDKLRGIGGQHEFLMVSTAFDWRRWGIKPSEARDAFSIAIDELNRRLVKGWIHSTGRKGSKAPNSTTAHNHLARIIKSSNGLREFWNNFEEWADQWLIEDESRPHGLWMQ